MRLDDTLLLEEMINALNWEAHDIEIRALHTADSNIANPLLYAICPCFVKGHIFFYVIVNLLRRERAESDIGNVHKRVMSDGICSGMAIGETNRRIDLMRLSAELGKHVFGVVKRVGLAEHLSVEPNDGVRGD